MKKVTKKEMFKKIMVVCSENKEIKNFCQKEIELLDKKRTYKSPKDIEKEKENIIIKKLLLETLSNTPLSIKELTEKNKKLSNYPSQKLASIIKTIENVEIEKDRVYKYYKNI